MRLKKGNHRRFFFWNFSPEGGESYGNESGKKCSTEKKGAEACMVGAGKEGWFGKSLLGDSRTSHLLLEWNWLFLAKILKNIQWQETKPSP